MVNLAHVQGQMKASSLAALVKLVEAHPDESLNVIRRWLNPEGVPS
jgi:flagellar M-ring protein FliF